MRRSKTISLAEALKDYIREMHLDDKLSEVGLINSWEEIVGKAISSRTSKIYIKDHVLFIYLSSSVVRNELMMLRASLRDKLNERAGREVIKDIVLKETLFFVHLICANLTPFYLNCFIEVFGRREMKLTLV